LALFEHVKGVFCASRKRFSVQNQAEAEAGMILTALDNSGREQRRVLGHDRCGAEERVLREEPLQILSNVLNPVRSQSPAQPLQVQKPIPATTSHYLQQRNAVFPQMLAQFGAVKVAIAREFQQESSIMTAMGQVKNSTTIERNNRFALGMSATLVRVPDSLQRKLAGQNRF
jgi:hypothetical protein